MFNNQLTLFLFSCIILSSNLCYAKKQNEIIIVTEEFPPYTIINRTNQNTMTGTDTDIIKKVFTDLNIKIKIEERPWKRALNEVKEGKAHAIYSLIKTKEREGFLWFPAQTLTSEKNILITRKKSKIQIKSLSDLNGRSVGTVKGYSYGKAFDEFKNFKRKEEAISNEQLLDILAASQPARIDVAVMNDQVFRYLLKNRKDKDDFAISDFVINEEPFYLGFSKANNDGKKLMEKFDGVLERLRKKGRIAKIIKNYQ